ncbi:MAG: PrgI family protein [Candidatus Paceibacterota bacterium]|jgi:hypothetical protein
MQFQVPQFIETEDKIVGPLTIKQFLFFAAAGALCFALFFVLKFWLWIIIAMILIVAAMAFAFIKVNGQPLIKVVVSAINFFTNPRLYLWQREEITKEIILPETREVKEQNVVIKRESLKNFFSEMPDIKNLWRDLATTKNPLPKRERTIAPAVKSTERFELFRKLSGQKEAARRVDYR